MKALSRRVRALEYRRNSTCDQLIVVPVYSGMSREEAYELKFGPAGSPPGATLIIVQNALPMGDFPYNWADWTDEHKAAARNSEGLPQLFKGAP